MRQAYHVRRTARATTRRKLLGYGAGFALAWAWWACTGGQHGR